MKVLHLRPMPALDFRADISLQRGAETLDLLDSVRYGQQPDGPDSGAGGPAPSGE